jgi:chromatin segregation and condensation protein Rec8/ScpA/Scc1 (kleisin family)
MSRVQERESLSVPGLATPPPLRVESDAFQGSLVTLFHLARDGRIDLAVVPLAPVCEAYFEYLETQDVPDVDAAGAALLALAYLVERKAWALLPIADPPPPQELPELPEPTAYEYAGAVDLLEEWHRERGKLFFRSADPAEAYEIPFDIGNVKPGDLARALDRLLNKARTLDVEPLARPRPSLADVMKGILNSVRRTGKATIEEMLPADYTRLDVVFVFLGVLELLRIAQLTAKMQGDDIVFELKAKS